MCAALPTALFHPAYREIEQEAESEDVNFATDPDFIFKCWQTYDVRAQYEDDLATPRIRNLFWRVWSNPYLRSVSNREFNQLWQRCGGDTPLGPYRPTPAVWPSCQQQQPLPQAQVKVLPSSRAELSSEKLQAPIQQSQQGPSSPTSPRVTKISFNQDTLEPPSRSGRDRGSSGASNGSSSRPALKRTSSGRPSAPSGISRGGRSRPGLMRRKSSQTRSTARISDLSVGRETDQDDARPSEISRARGRLAAATEQNRLPIRPASGRATFELASSWQSDDGSGDEKATPSSIGPSGSLVQPNFRSKFAEQRQLSSGTSLPTMDAIRKVRSSVRFVDDEDTSDKGKGKARPSLDDNDSAESRQRSNSQVLADSDDSEDRTELPRVQSQLSMMIQDKRKQSGSRDIGPSSQPDGSRSNEARRKRDELLRMGREAAKPIIPTSRSRRSSREREEDRYRSPSPTATF